MSTPFGQLDKLSEQMTGAGVDHFQVMLDSGYFPAIRKAVVDDFALPSRDELIKFIVLSSLRPSIMELPGIVIPDNASVETLKAAGKYDLQSYFAKQYLNDKHFRITTVHGPRNLFLVRFKRNVTIKHVEAAAEVMDYDVGLVEDLLCVGAHPEHRKLQLQFPIIAPGSSAVVDGSNRPYTPYLHGWVGKRRLRLTACDGWWHEYCRFLFVGKDTPSAVT